MNYYLPNDILNIVFEYKGNEGYEEGVLKIKGIISESSRNESYEVWEEYFDDDLYYPKTYREVIYKIGNGSYNKNLYRHHRRFDGVMFDIRRGVKTCRNPKCHYVICDGSHCESESESESDEPVYYHWGYGYEDDDEWEF